MSNSEQNFSIDKDGEHPIDYYTIFGLLAKIPLVFDDKW